MYEKVVGGSVMIIGDLHISDVFTGKHKGYLENCFWVLNKITAKIVEKKPKAIVLSGDIVGWNETNIRDRQILSQLCKVFKQWREICPIYAVRGNHDVKGYPEFQFLNDLGLIKTASDIDGFFDYFGHEGQDVPEVRFHLVDYNNESTSLNINTDGASNLVCGHNNYTINGVTTWYSEHDGIELGMMQNFSDVDMVISGHIHNPSPEIYSTQMPSGKNCMLFYTGCPTRPIKDKNMYDSCWFVFVEYNQSTNQTDIKTDEFKLKPASEIFFEDEDFVEEKSEEEVQNELRKEALKDVLGDIMKYRLNGGSPLEQIDRIPNASDEAKQVAKEYLQIAFNRTA